MTAEERWSNGAGRGMYYLRSLCHSLTGEQFCELWNNLTRADRKLLVDRFCRCKTLKTLSQEMGISAGAVDRRVHMLVGYLFICNETDLGQVLPRRVLLALRRRGLEDREALTAYLSSGKRLEDIPGIGPSSAVKITRCLEVATCSL